MVLDHKFEIGDGGHNTIKEAQGGGVADMNRALILDIWMVMQMRFEIQTVQNLRRWIRLSFN